MHRRGMAQNRLRTNDSDRPSTVVISGSLLSQRRKTWPQINEYFFISIISFHYLTRTLANTFQFCTFRKDFPVYNWIVSTHCKNCQFSYPFVIHTVPSTFERGRPNDCRNHWPNPPPIKKASFTSQLSDFLFFNSNEMRRYSATHQVVYVITLKP